MRKMATRALARPIGARDLREEALERKHFSLSEDVRCTRQAYSSWSCAVGLGSHCCLRASGRKAVSDCEALQAEPGKLGYRHSGTLRSRNVWWPSQRDVAFCVLIGRGTLPKLQMLRSFGASSASILAGSSLLPSQLLQEAAGPYWRPRSPCTVFSAMTSHFTHEGKLPERHGKLRRVSTSALTAPGASAHDCARGQCAECPCSGTSLST